MRRTSDLGASGYRNVGEFAPGIHWFQMALPLQGLTHKLLMIDDPDWYAMGRTVQSLFNVFLIEDEQNMLIDQGPIQQRNEVGELVEEVLDGEPLDYIFVTHPDVDHTGTLHELMETYPEATVVATGVRL
jgi:flavorubredoxin